MRNMRVSEDISIAASQSLKEKEYWLENLSGEIEKVNFPPDFHHIHVQPTQPSAGEKNIEAAEFKFTGELYERLMTLSNGSDSRLHMILVAALTVLLYRCTGKRDIIIGTTIDRQEIDARFINTILPLRNKLKDSMTFKELLLQVRETIYGAIEHQNYPLESLLNQLDLTISGDEFPLFDMAILLENLHDRKYLRDIRVSLLFYFSSTDECIKGGLEYSPSRYETFTIERIIAYFMRALEKTVFNVDIRLSAVDLLTAEERQQILVDFNDTTSGYPGNKRIHQLFAEQVERTPQDIALVEADRDCSVTYRELNEKANQLAHLLMDRGVKEDTIVGVMLDRSIEMIAGILGILKAGGAYLPMDPDSPTERIRFMLEDSGARPVLTQKSVLETFDFIDEPVLLDLPETYREYRDHRENPGNTGGIKSLTYLIYTSGTTGKPKGVLLEHRAVVNYVHWAAGRYVRNETVHFPLYTSVSFDLTVTSLFTPLITGNTVVVYGRDMKEFLIHKVARQNRVEVVKLTPSHLKLIRDKLEGETSKIKRFIVGGEELETRLSRWISDIFNSNVEIYNEYGPTEAAVGCMIYKYNPDEDKRKSVPIGTPAHNVRIYVLDGSGRPVPRGAVGEIFISGDGVARGYLNRVALTAEKFVPDPFVSGFTGKNNQAQMMYRTGDLARWLEKGDLEFLGRRDEQVNIRGFRVELGEIQNRLLKHKGIKDAVVITRDDGAGEHYLCAYIVTDTPEDVDGAGNVTVEELRRFLVKRLPNYMLPSYFVYLKEMPLTSNGKLNKRALPEPVGSLETGTEYVPPGSETEKKLVEIWQKQLGLARVGIMDNFFNVGGDSIKSVGLLSAINRAFEIDLKIVHLYRNETIEKFALQVEQAIAEAGDSAEKFKNALVEMDEMKNEFLKGFED